MPDSERHERSESACHQPIAVPPLAAHPNDVARTKHLGGPSTLALA